MSRAYLTQKTKEALAACAGDRRDAALLLRAWSDGDIALREALVAPFMTNLCALAVQRVAARDAGPATPPNAPRRPVKPAICCGRSATSTPKP